MHANKQLVNSEIVNIFNQIKLSNDSVKPTFKFVLTNSVFLLTVYNEKLMLFILIIFFNLHSNSICKLTLRREFDWQTI